MKSIKFASHLIPKVLSGQKTSTWRMFDDKDFQVGDEISCINKESGQEFAQAKISQIQEKKLQEISENDYEGHERYADLTTMIAAFQKYYGKNVNQDSIVKIIHFQLIK